MNNDSNYWFNLPSNLISKIGSYCNKELRLDLRLVNFHWSQTINKLVFSTINGRDRPGLDCILNKYSQLIARVTSVDRSKIEIAIKISSKAKSLSTLGIWLGYSSHVDYLTSLLSASNQITSLVIDDTDRDDTGLRYRINRNDLCHAIKQYQYLFNLEISLMCGYLQQTFDSVQFDLLLRLKLEIYANQLESCVKAIAKSNRLKSLNLKVWDISDEYDEFNLTNILTIKDLVTSTLTQFKLLITNYFDDNMGTFQQHLRSELLSIFSSFSTLSNLKTFDFNFIGGDVDLIANLFSSQIPLPNYKWSNLTRLSLPEVDNYLMNYIINQCPNLKSLIFDSALTLRFDTSSDKLKPLNYLTKLYFKGFKIDLIDNEQLIKYLFPNVVTLAIHFSYIESNSILMDAYYIPILFPNLTKVIIASCNYNLEGLIYQTSYLLNWKELYIEVGRPNKHLIKPLTTKLLNLKSLYIGDGGRICDFNFDFEFGVRKFKLFWAMLEENEKF
ncbi:hypothetical protein CONCODRAFT_73443 [Conidiobolus coronatus NRRL 28638]|uniref:F-box domain-containing protein n=1 Tax=Conidiobolus coronatus (strain ATCC 28846 / CBS 209.66 / NRRL 28638) TaxID=796925 RepID=A0A137NVS7_CONC2|nr:hypothetical protein CONCODRAFT_73443 [Conidiobolus coronatus NRRL 28638]|eukprot:KXN66778.1 hypothetical protein CONCODRAFT_73443 [Conidiobolus coronatus NRRL 28638]